MSRSVPVFVASWVSFLASKALHGARAEEVLLQREGTGEREAERKHKRETGQKERREMSDKSECGDGMCADGHGCCHPLGSLPTPQGMVPELSNCSHVSV